MYITDELDEEIVLAVVDVGIFWLFIVTDTEVDLDCLALLTL
jgi:hypothetical protein